MQQACCSIWPISELSGKALHFKIAKSGRCFIQVINRWNIANRSFTHLLNALSTLSTSLNLLAQGGRCQSAFLFFIMIYLRKTIWLPSGNFEAWLKTQPLTKYHITIPDRSTDTMVIAITGHKPITAANKEYSFELSTFVFTMWAMPGDWIRSMNL